MKYKVRVRDTGFKYNYLVGKLEENISEKVIDNELNLVKKIEKNSSYEFVLESDENVYTNLKNKYDSNGEVSVERLNSQEDIALASHLFCLHMERNRLYTDSVIEANDIDRRGSPGFREYHKVARRAGSMSIVPASDFFDVVVHRLGENGVLEVRGQEVSLDTVDWRDKLVEEFGDQSFFHDGYYSTVPTSKYQD